MADLSIQRFTPADQQAARALILQGLAEHWGELDLSLNPDLNDIAASYAAGVFLCAWLEGNLVGTGAIVPEGEGVMRVARMSVQRERRRTGIATDTATRRTSTRTSRASWSPGATRGRSPTSSSARSS